MAKLDDKMAVLATMSSAQLRDEWRRLFKLEPPRLGPDLLRHAIAHRLQEQAHGSLPSIILRQLRAVGRGQKGAAPQLRAGTRLMRRWQGRSISVIVSDEGFEFDGHTYGSLSAIAREVTGANWSGPRFFGLTGEAARG